MRLLPQVVPATEDEVGFCVEGGAHLPQAAVAAGAFQAVLVPVLLDGLQEEAVADALLTAAAGEQRRRHLEDLVHGLPTEEGGEGTQC